VPGVVMEKEWGWCGIYDWVMGCRHSRPLLCFHASNIRTTR